MAGSDDHRSSSASRGSISRQNSTRSSNPDVFSDDHALESFEVADGFRPTTQPQPPPPPPPRTPPRMTTRRSVALQPNYNRSPEVTKKKPVQQGSTAGLNLRNSFSLQHDAQYADAPRRALSTASNAAPSESSLRPSSTISGFTVPRVQSPYDGPSGPSHPYGMYPQNTSLNRASTNSTIRPADRPYSGPNRPIHPYGMYPQTTSPDGEPDVLIGSTDITSVGFPGHTQQYSTRLGANGENPDDIIGPDGHTEQLPPYTRYPEGAHSPKPGAAWVPNLGPSSSTGPLQAVVVGAGTSNSSLPRVMTSDQHNAGLTRAADAYAEGNPSTKEKWAERGRKRTCFGKLPVWAVILLLLLLVIVAATIGASIGRVISNRSGHSSQAPTSSAPTSSAPPNAASTIIVTTTYVDAAALTATPTNLPSLPTGDYTFALGGPSTSSNKCLSDAGQAGAWECASGALLKVNVENVDFDTARVYVENIPLVDKPRYGAVAPSFQSQTGVALMYDKDEPDNGPAYFFAQQYNKTVILPENAIDTAVPGKRSLKPEALDMARRGSSSVIQPGTKPWICFWDQTMLEGFIYVNINASATGSQNSLAGQLASSTAQISTAPTSEPTIYPNQGAEKRNADSSVSPAGELPCYPKLVKLEERRSSMDAKAPYCRRMQVLDDESFGLAQAIDTDGPLVVDLIETESYPQRGITLAGREEAVGRYKRLRKGRKRRRSDDADEEDHGEDACHCEWIGS